MCSHSTCLLKECLHFHGGTVRRGWPYVSHLIPHSSLESESLALTARWSVATQNIKHCFDMETVSELRSACAIILKQIGIFLLHIVKAPSATIYIVGSMSDFFFLLFISASAEIWRKKITVNSLVHPFCYCLAVQLWAYVIPALEELMYLAYFLRNEALFSLVRGKSVWHNCPSPELGKHPYTWIFLPPHFSVGLMRCHIILCLVHLRLLLLAETKNLVSSENGVFQSSAVKCGYV